MLLLIDYASSTILFSGLQAVKVSLGRPVGLNNQGLKELGMGVWGCQCGGQEGRKAKYPVLEPSLWLATIILI